ncbi:MAG: ATP-binding cassette domain-containing protein [Candidatus Nanopelagicales bacterium]
MTVEAIGLGKTYGGSRAVDDLSFTLAPGMVTGFLGPNGAGKSTTMRLMLGLDRGDGSTLWDGRPLAQVSPVTTTVGAHLDARFFHPTRSARNHLRMLATEAGVPATRVDEVLKLVGLESVERKKPKGFSLGMAQRLGLAGAILAQPKVLLLDEPANGLDPQSIQWLRDFLQHYAQQGNVVFVSSHLLSEMQLMAEHLVVIAKGRLVADETLDDFVARSTRNDVLVRVSDPDALERLLREQGLTVVREGEDRLAVATSDTDLVGDAAFRAGVVVRELTRRTASLEQAFLELTSEDQQFRTGGAA